MGARDPMRDGVVHALVREHFAAFAEQVQEGGRSLPRYVVAEFEAFVRCGVLACGVMRARCAGCGHDRLVAFSWHAIDVAPLGELTPDWGAFVAAQREGAVAQQRARGLGESWVEQIPAFLDAWAPPAEGPRALLHTELMREHLLVSPGPRGWTLTGLFDFEPAMVGDPEYDFASFGVFVSCGDGRFLRRALRAYGHGEDALDEALPRRLLAHAILHRYSNLRWYLERVPAPGATRLDELAARWWSLGEPTG